MAGPLLGDDDPRAIAYLFHALAHQQRVRILRHLHEHGPTTIKELRDVVWRAGAGDAWQHIKVLKGAGLVGMVGRGKLSKWELMPDALSQVAGLIVAADHRDTQ